MKSVRTSFVQTSTDAPTGLGNVTGGCLPSARAILPATRYGFGITVFRLRFSVPGARYCREPGIFDAFEETSKYIVPNTEYPGRSFAPISGLRSVGTLSRINTVMQLLGQDILAA